jgi:parallel beta-helix repeat protein
MPPDPGPGPVTPPDPGPGTVTPPDPGPDKGTTPPPPPKPKFTVPDEYATIQEAIKGAKPGDTIAVANGTYEEYLTLKDGVHLKAETMGEVTIQVDSSIASHLTIKDCKSGSVDGFRFFDPGVLDVDPEIVANKKKVNPAVHIISSTVEMKNCKFSGRGDGVLITGAGTSTLTSCEAINNTLSGYLITGSSRVTLQGCRGQSNGDHGITIASNSDATLVDCVFTNNSKSGIYLESEGSATLEGTRSETNTEVGVLLMNGGNSFIMKSGAVSANSLEGIIVNNEVDPRAIILNGGSNLVDLFDVEIAGNKKDGIVLFSPMRGSKIEKCRVTGNFGYGMGIAGEAGHTIEIIGNQVSGSVDGIYAEGEGLTATITGNTCSGNAIGIHLLGGVLGKVDGNDCRGNTTGLQIEDAVPELTVGSNQQ